MSNDAKRKPIWFPIAATASGSDTLEYEVKEDCTIERMIFRFYAGQENAVRLTPYLLRPGSTPEYLLDFVTADKYIAGDDDKFDFDVALPIRANTKICIDWSNQNASYAYNALACIVIDTLFGLERVG